MAHSIRKKCTLPAQKRSEFVNSISKDDQDDVPKDAVRILYSTLQFKHFPKRKELIDLFIDDTEPHHSLLLDCVEGMQDIYKKLPAAILKLHL